MKQTLILAFCLSLFISCEKEALLPSAEDSSLEINQIQQPADVFVEYLDGIGFFDEEQSGYGYASFRIFTNADGIVDVEILEAEESDKPSEHLKRDNCVAGNGITYDHCDDFGTGALAKVKAGKFISESIGDCADGCFETRNERLENGRYMVFVRCCP